MKYEVRFDAVREMIIIMRDDRKHYVDLRSNQLVTSDDILNEILQLHEKSWCDGRILHDFVTTLQDVVNLRFGVDMRALRGKRLNWRTGQMEEE